MSFCLLFYSFFIAYVFQNVSQADEEFKSLPEVGKCPLLLIGQTHR